eukprot:m.35423 g.35423  ORF g.35423 m.35423 type:complete len:113 (+) comp14417_c0_seq3:2091-2429(+)
MCGIPRKIDLCVQRACIVSTPGVDEVDDTDIVGVGLVFACFLSVLTTISMQGLFNIRMQLEDPFASGTSFDAIDIEIETESLVDRLSEDSSVPCIGKVNEGTCWNVLGCCCS